MAFLQQVELNKKILWLAAEKGKTSGVLIEDPSDYIHGRMSYGHVMSNGQICRHNRIIGKFGDLKFNGITKSVKVAPDAIQNAWNAFLLADSIIGRDN